MLQGIIAAIAEEAPATAAGGDGAAVAPSAVVDAAGAAADP